MVALQLPEITDGRPYSGSARLFYAYADALLDAGREEEARGNQIADGVATDLQPGVGHSFVK